jgi:dehydrogenase/reductase SDR family protein 4
MSDGFIYRIGYAIAEKLGQDGAKVMISSRKQKNVDASLQKLKSLGIEASGMVCHVAKKEDRQKMIQKVYMFIHYMYYHRI